jgi:hypothetical protein
VAFTYDVSTNRGKVRLLCFDRVEADAAFTDAEIDAFLSLANDDALLGASLACLDLATRGVKNFSAVTVGAWSVRGDQPTGWKELADRYEAMAYKRAGGDFIDMMGGDSFGYSELETLKALRGESD